MSRNYNLHTRTATSILSQVPIPSPDPECCLYSDVAASRPPSPSGDRENPTTATGNAGAQAMGEPSDEDVGHSQKYMFSTANTASRVSAEASEEPDSSPWQTVRRQ